MWNFSPGDTCSNLLYLFCSTGCCELSTFHFTYGGKKSGQMGNKKRSRKREAPSYTNVLQSVAVDVGRLEGWAKGDGGKGKRRP